MSYWAAKVITNMFSAVPLIGDYIVTWLWGGFTVDNPTLNRFYSFHYLLPFVIVAVVILHLWALHRFGSNNPLGIEANGPQDKIPFHPYYTIKDAFGLGVFLVLFAAILFFAPNSLGEPINYVEANPLVTPAHIVPEWYFLPYYAILRSVTFDIWFLSAKLIGVVLMFGSTLILFLMPWLDRSPVKSARFRPAYKMAFWVLVFDCVVLGWVGANPPEPPFLYIGQVATFWYFFHFLVLVPLLSLPALDRPKPLPVSISEPVLKGGGAASAGASTKPMEKAP
jgi:quinol-cytochrome oxidoreductase complex cytochrome b subunit